MLKAEKINDVTVISFSEETKLNILISQAVKEDISNYIRDPNPKLVLNLEGIQYIDSSGFGVLLSILRTVKNKNGSLKICNVANEVMELVKLLQLHNVFDFGDNVDLCTKSF